MSKERVLTTEELKEAVKPIPPPSEASKSTSAGSSSSKSKSKSSKPAAGSSDRVLHDGLVSSFEFLGAGVSFFDEWDGQLLEDKADKLAAALVDLSKSNPKVRNALENLVTGSAWSGVALVFGTELVLPMAVHHGVLPEPINSIMADARGIPVKASKGDNLSVVNMPEQNADDSDSEPR